MDACLFLFSGIGSVSKRTANSLQYEGEEVAAYEREGVGARAEARMSLAIGDDDARKAEIDGRGEEGGRNC
jgi:hypothetical protein